MNVPQNEFKVGHAGAVLALTVNYSTGDAENFFLQTRNQDVAEYLMERFVEFLVQYPMEGTHAGIRNHGMGKKEIVRI